MLDCHFDVILSAEIVGPTMTGRMATGAGANARPTLAVDIVGDIAGRHWISAVGRTPCRPTPTTRVVWRDPAPGHGDGVWRTRAYLISVLQIGVTI